MNKFNVKLCDACTGMFLKKRLRMHKIASLADISITRFSKILNGKLKPTIKEKRILSKILKTPQKDLF